MNDRVVLIVEDNPDIAWVEQTILRSAGIQVRLAMGAGQVLNPIAWGDVDVALVDLHGTNGEELLRFLRARCPHVSRGICSAWPHRARDLVDQGDADFFIAKPFTSADLVAAVGGLNGRHDG